MMNNAIGIDEASNSPTGAGVTVNGSGEIVVTGNYGEVNDIDISTGDLTSNGSTIPISFTKSQEANGESTVTDFIVFDSLGQAVNIKMSAVLESRDSVSTTYRYYMESADDSSGDVFLSSETVTFDSNGKVIDGNTAIFQVLRDNTAAVSPMQITIDMSQVSGISSESAGSSISLSSQDGSDPGTLTNFVIDETGVINGVFDNGIIRTLGQVTLARFSNPQGLLEAGSTTFREGSVPVHPSWRRRVTLVPVRFRRGRLNSRTRTSDETWWT
ncbi:MAG: flagellar basal body FlgE domain-containing protein [Planctomycetaceae bacterium]